MSATHLVVVPTPQPQASPAEPLSIRIRRLQAEARAMAHEHVEQPPRQPWPRPPVWPPRSPTAAKPIRWALARLRAACRTTPPSSP